MATERPLGATPLRKGESLKEARYFSFLFDFSKVGVAGISPPLPLTILTGGGLPLSLLALLTRSKKQSVDKPDTKNETRRSEATKQRASDRPTDRPKKHKQLTGAVVSTSRRHFRCGCETTRPRRSGSMIHT